MTTAVTAASRQPMAKPIRTTIETVASPRWNSSSLAFSLARFAIVAGDGDLDAVGDQRALQRSRRARRTASATTTALAPARLAMARLTAGRVGQAVCRSAHATRAPGPRAGPERCWRRRADRPARRPPRRRSAGRPRSAKTRCCRRRRPRPDRSRADRTDGKAAVGLGRSVDDVAKRHAVQRPGAPDRGRCGSLRPAADDEGQADVVDLGDLGAQFRGDVVQRLVGPPARRARFGRQGQHHDRHVVDPAH